MSKELVRREIEKLRNKQRAYEMRAKEAEQFGDDLSAANFRGNALDLDDKIHRLRDEGLSVLHRKPSKHRRWDEGEYD